MRMGWESSKSADRARDQVQLSLSGRLWGEAFGIYAYGASCRKHSCGLQPHFQFPRPRAPATLQLGLRLQKATQAHAAGGQVRSLAGPWCRSLPHFSQAWWPGAQLGGRVPGPGCPALWYHKQ